jgi:hypothetical protein
VQLRECRLLKLNLKTGELNDYFTMLGFTDLTLKQVNDYCHLPGGAVLVTASRLMDRNLLLKSTVTGSEVWLFNNTVKNISGDLIDLSLSTSLPAGDSIFLAGPQGLYLKTTSDLHPLLRWRSSHQEIIEKQYKMDFDFLPRSLKRISAARFIAGGMWGGLYLLDLVQNKITCLDDVSYDKVENMDLTEL